MYSSSPHWSRCIPTVLLDFSRSVSVIAFFIKAD
jgi:hypothetical protein